MHFSYAFLGNNNPATQVQFTYKLGLKANIKPAGSLGGTGLPYPSH
jgi:hypothetical protein